MPASGGGGGKAVRGLASHVRAAENGQPAVVSRSPRVASLVAPSLSLPFAFVRARSRVFRSRSVRDREIVIKYFLFFVRVTRYVRRVPSVTHVRLYVHFTVVRRL